MQICKALYINENMFILKVGINPAGCKGIRGKRAVT
jgi:hypothetical protein